MANKLIFLPVKEIKSKLVEKVDILEFRELQQKVDELDRRLKNLLETDLEKLSEQVDKIDFDKLKELEDELSKINSLLISEDELIKQQIEKAIEDLDLTEVEEELKAYVDEKFTRVLKNAEKVIPVHMEIDTTDFTLDLDYKVKHIVELGVPIFFYNEDEDIVIVDYVTVDNVTPTTIKLLVTDELVEKLKEISDSGYKLYTKFNYVSKLADVMGLD